MLRSPDVQPGREHDVQEWRVGDTIIVQELLSDGYPLGYLHFIKMVGPNKQTLYLSFWAVKPDPNGGTLLEESLKGADETLKKMEEERKELTPDERDLVDKIRREGLQMVENGSITSIEEISYHVYLKYHLSADLIAKTSTTLNQLVAELGYVLVQKDPNKINLSNSIPPQSK
jgi:hypothetical protein